MMTTLLITAAVLAGMFFFEIIAALKAPVGYQDETGFHFGPEETSTVSEETAMAEAFGVLNPT